MVKVQKQKKKQDFEQVVFFFFFNYVKCLHKVGIYTFYFQKVLSKFIFLNRFNKNIRVQSVTPLLRKNVHYYTPVMVV